MLTYDSNENASVRLFLCKSSDNGGRVTTVSDQNIANPKELKDPYKKMEAVSHSILHGVKPYTAVVSTFNRNEPMGGKLTLESDSPMIFKMLPDEGHGYVKQVFNGEFEFQNSGGCSNFGTFDKNPAYCI